jgi:hypothetical protein
VPDGDDCETDNYKFSMLSKPLDDNGECYGPICNAFRIELQQYVNGGLSIYSFEWRGLFGV